MGRQQMPGEGSVFQRSADGRWVAALKVGPRGQSRTWVRYLPLRENRKGERHCRRLAEKLLDELIADVRAGRRRTVPTTLGAFLARWRDVYATQVGASQAANADWLLGRIVPSLGSINLTDLAPSDIERFLGQMDLSSQSRRHAYNLLAKALDSAVRDDLVTRNVVRLVSPPVVTRIERAPWSLPETARFLEAARNDRYYPAYLLALHPGLRQGEILGLRWEDIDLDGLTVRVGAQLQRRAGEYVRVVTKDRRASTRPIPEGTAVALREHRRRQLTERAAAGKSTEDGLVFVTPNGRPVNGSWLTHHFERLAKDAKLRVIPFHALRNTAGSLMATLNVHPKVAQAQLGHADVATTLRIYTHTTDPQTVAAAARIADALGLGHAEVHADASEEG